LVEGEKVPIIASDTFEKLLEKGLKSYCSFAREHLRLPLPVLVEAGAAGISGYYIAMDAVKYGSWYWGPIHQDHISWSGPLNAWTDEAQNTVLLRIFQAFFDACGRERPNGFRNFPPASVAASART
jgi:hypothetical protein